MHDPEPPVEVGEGYAIGPLLEPLTRLQRGRGTARGRRQDHQATGSGPASEALERPYRLSHGLGDGDLAGNGLDDFGATVDRVGVVQSELSPHLALKVVALLAGLDQMDGELRLEDRDGESRKAGTAAEVREVCGGAELGESGEQPGGVEDQARGHLEGIAVPCQIHPWSPGGEEQHEPGKLVDLDGGVVDPLLELGEALRDAVTDGLDA